MDIVTDHNVLAAFSLTLLAGLSTGIGSGLAIFTSKTNKQFLSAALGFSAGVMIYVSFVELLTTAQSSLQEYSGETAGAWYTALAFFGGILFILIIDNLVPSFENPHEIHKVEEIPEKGPIDHKLLRLGVFSAIAIGIHNFPEGFATFAATLKDPKLGISIAVAIAIHNIPEGISVAVPVFQATGSRKKAFWYSFLSGLAEPVGAIIGYLLLRPFMTEAVFGIMFAAVAGIMVFISLDELLPAAKEYGSGHNAIYGLVCGMAVMAVSLLLFM